jgi:Fic family protein
MFTYSATSEIAAHVTRIEVLRAEVDRQGPLPRVWLGRTRRDLEAEATAASVRLEGISVTADEARRILAGDPPATVEAEDVAHVLGYREAMALVLGRADDPAFIYQRELVLGIHRAVMSGSYAEEAGRVRRIQNRLVDRSSGREVFVPPAPADVPGLLDDMCELLHTEKVSAPVASALAHVRLAAIHPFRDGNGRTARIVASLAMFRGGYRSPYFTSLEEWWGRHPERYYSAFECLGMRFDPHADVTPFVRAHVEAQAAQAEALSLRNAIERALWTVLEDLAAHELKVDERAAHALYDALFGRTVTNRYYRALADVSDVTAVNDLRRLVAAGMLEPRGGGRTSHYVGTVRLLDTIAGGAGVDVGSLPDASYCERADAVIAALASRMQGGEVREDSVPYCAAR